VLNAVLLKVNDMALENVEDPSGQLAKAAEIVQKKELKGADGFLEEVNKINEFVSKRYALSAVEGRHQDD
jgi:hypothetical protein